jgi:antitoxin VapB
MLKTAKVFMTGRSQAVRLPAEFRFDADEVFIRRDDKSGDVILSSRTGSWKEVFAALKAAGVTEPLLGPKDRDMSPPPDRVKF